MRRYIRRTGRSYRRRFRRTSFRRRYPRRFSMRRALRRRAKPELKNIIHRAVLNPGPLITKTQLLAIPETYARGSRVDQFTGDRIKFMGVNYDLMLRVYNDEAYNAIFTLVNVDLVSPRTDMNRFTAWLDNLSWDSPLDTDFVTIYKSWKFTLGNPVQNVDGNYTFNRRIYGYLKYPRMVSISGDAPGYILESKDYLYFLIRKAGEAPYFNAMNCSITSKIWYVDI